MPCVCSLHRLLKKQQTRATHSYNTLWRVFTVMPVVFFALPGKETADLCNTLLQTLWCVFNAEVFLALSSFWTNNCKDIFDVIPSATSPFGAAVIH